MQVPLNPESSTSPDIECKREQNDSGAIELPAVNVKVKVDKQRKFLRYVERVSWNVTDESRVTY